MSEFDKLRKKLKKEFDNHLEIDEDSELPVHEKFTKERKIKK